MMIFDASNRDQCEAKRSSTNTPLQALTMLNDPTVLEASRVLAESMSLSPQKLSDKIEQAFERIVIRKPTRIEKNRLVDYCTQQILLLKEKPSVVSEALAIGEYRHPTEKYDVIEAAALMNTILIIVLLNSRLVRHSGYINKTKS